MGPQTGPTSASGMAVLTVRGWTTSALPQRRRVVCYAQIVVLSRDRQLADRDWMITGYVPASHAMVRALPNPRSIAQTLRGGAVEVVGARSSAPSGSPPVVSSSQGLPGPGARAARIARTRSSRAERPCPGIERLASDLAIGAQRRRHPELRTSTSTQAGYRLAPLRAPFHYGAGLTASTSVRLAVVSNAPSRLMS